MSSSFADSTPSDLDSATHAGTAGTAGTAGLESIKSKIDAIATKPVSEHPAAYEEIHGELQKALSEIEGL